MLQELGKHHCGLRVSGKEKKVEERGGKERKEREGKSLEDRTEQKQKEKQTGLQGVRRTWRVGGRGPHGKKKKGRRQWLPQHRAAAPWWLSHGYFGGVNFLPI